MKLALPDIKLLLGAVKDPWLIAGVVSWLVVLGAMTPLFLRSRGQLEALRPRLEKATADSSLYAELYQAKVAYETTRDSLVSQINLIRDIDKDRYIWPHILDAVAKALPDYTWLESLLPRAVEGDSSSGTGFQITGKSGDVQAVTHFIRVLEDSPFIQDVEAGIIGAVTEEGQDFTTFTINARYQVPDSTQITLQPLAATLVRGVRSGGGARR